MIKVYAAKKKYVYELWLSKSNMTYFTNALLMFLTGTVEFDWQGDRIHHGEFVFKGFTFLFKGYTFICGTLLAASLKLKKSIVLELWQNRYFLYWKVLPLGNM